MRLAGTLLTLFAWCCFAAEHADESYTVPGLEEPAEIIVDEWGVPHIYAATHYDAFFVQGFNAARDRLWQIDTWRRRGLGKLAEVLGAAYLQQDRATRLFLYRGDLYREWLAYGSDAKKIAQAFTAGINAYVELVYERPDLLPPEFGLLGYGPAKWRPSDVVRIRSHGLLRNVASEVRRARIICEAGLSTAGYWRKLEPAWTTEIPAGLVPCSIPEDVLQLYLLAKAPVLFNAPQLAAAKARALELDLTRGSNNWTVSPRRSATGRPVLANDPHRGHSVPSLRYISHLVAPDLNVIGAGEPALPGISIGHNEQIAFGLTIFSIDQEDLYVYERSDKGYRYRGEWRPFETISESVAVRGQEPVTMEFRFTRHGPVVYENQKLAFAVRAAWLDAGMAPYFGSVEYMRAGNWREFSGSLNRWGAPSENQVYADTSGNIGYKPAGLFPRRPNWDGLLPVPGDGRFEWDGYFDMDVLPAEYNPERGYSGTANSMNLPAAYPIEEFTMGLEWAEPWRYDRVMSTLASQPAHTLEDSAALQRDYRSLLAVKIIARLPAAADGAAMKMLRDWDATLSPNSAAAALYGIWLHRHLLPAFEQQLVPENPTIVSPLGGFGALRMMREAGGAETVVATLDAAFEDAKILLGDEPAAWRWGALHEIRFRHPLQHLASGELADAMRYQAYPRGGSGNTTNNTRFGRKDFLVAGGASYRMVLDVGNWDAATMTNAPGQSGDPRSPFYDNLLEGWANDGSFPLIYSREKVETHRALTISLLPRE